MRIRCSIDRKFTDRRYTFHWIYVGILDTVTTVTIQLFGSHRLLGANWGSLIFDRAHFNRQEVDTRLSRSQKSLVEPLKAFLSV